MTAPQTSIAAETQSLEERLREAEIARLTTERDAAIADANNALNTSLHGPVMKEQETIIMRMEAERDALVGAESDRALVCWAMCVQDATWEEWGSGKGEFCFAGLRHATHLDDSGCPVLTPHLRDCIITSKSRGSALSQAGSP